LSLQVGDTAPDFELPSHQDREKKVKLSDLRGQNVVLAFYPFDWTPVCSTQMPQYEKDKDRFADHNAVVLGISVDSAPSHAAWAQSFGGVSFDLLSDFHPKGEVSRAYGTFREDDGFSNRDIFIIDKEGKIVYIDRHAILDVPKNEELFAVLESLN
jgi:peroxiredoxin